MSNEPDVVTLLLVEDDDVDAMAIQRGFFEQRILNPIVRARDGLEALELLRSGTVPDPYIILLDLQMPRMNGFEFLDEIRSDPRLHNSVVFVLTTSTVEQDIADSYQKNIAGYFTKDMSNEAYLNIINLLDGYWKIVHLPKIN
ncbi:MAG: response regulator [Porticoccaceae bacterium]|nr:response regulator [Porticoccaceae bacterium]